MVLYVVTQPDPPAGTDFQFVVPGNQIYDVTGITATLITPSSPTPIVAHDSSGNGHDGTYSFNHPIDPLVPGLVAGDQAIDFSQGLGGYNGNVTIPFAPLRWGSDWTIEGWIQDTNVNGTNYVCGVTDLAHTSTIRLRYDSGVNPQIILNNAAFFFVNGAVGTPPRDFLPHHVVVTQAAGVITFYVDGVVDPTVVIGAHPPDVALDRTAIGSDQPGVSRFSTLIQDEWAFYTAALSGAQVAAHFAAAAVSFAAYTTAVLADGPAMYYHLDDSGAGTGRQPSLVVTNGTTELEAIPTGFPAVATPGPYQYAWEPHLNADSQSSDGTLTTVAIPELFLPAGYTVGTRTLDLQPADQWSQVTLWWDDSLQRRVFGADAFAYPPGARLVIVPAGG